MHNKYEINWVFNMNVPSVQYIKINSGHNVPFVTQTRFRSQFQ